MAKVTRWLISRDGLTAFYETEGYWYDLTGMCLYKVIGTNVFRMQGGARAFHISDGWAFDATGAARYYYGR
jgi:hypothetical protein